MKTRFWKKKIIKDVLERNQSRGTINQRYKVHAKVYQNTLKRLISKQWIIERSCKPDLESPDCRQCFEFTKYSARRPGRPRKTRKRRGRSTTKCLRFNFSKLYEMSHDSEILPILQQSEKVLEFIINQYQHLLVEENTKEEFKEHLMSSPAFFCWMVHPDRERLARLLRSLGGYINFFYDYFFGYRGTSWDPQKHPVLKRCQTVEKLRLLYAITKAVDILEGRAASGFSFGATMLECEVKYYLVSELIQLVEAFDEVKFLARILSREKEKNIQELEANLNGLSDCVLIARAIVDKAERDEYQKRVETLREEVLQLRDQLRQELQEVIGKSGLG